MARITTAIASGFAGVLDPKVFDKKDPTERVLAARLAEDEAEKTPAAKRAKFLDWARQNYSAKIAAEVETFINGKSKGVPSASMTQEDRIRQEARNRGFTLSR